MSSSLSSEVGPEAAARIERLASAAEKLSLAPADMVDSKAPVDDSTWQMPE